VGEWWTRFQDAPESEREEMLLPADKAGAAKKRRRRRKPRSEDGPDASAAVPAGDDV
jgi:hypothetical protein